MNHKFEMYLRRGRAHLLAHIFGLFGLGGRILREGKRDVNTSRLGSSVLVEGQRFADLHGEGSAVHLRAALHQNGDEFSEVVALAGDGAQVDQQISGGSLAFNDTVGVNVRRHQEFLDVAQWNSFLLLLEFSRQQLDQMTVSHQQAAQLCGKRSVDLVDQASKHHFHIAKFG